MRKHIDPANKPNYFAGGEVPIDDFVSIMDTLLATETNGSKKSKVMKGRKMHWYKLIIDGDLTCPATGIKVERCRLDIQKHPSPKVDDTYHFNFYSADGKLFTIDHKTPLAQGGRDVYENVQPMIAEFNWDKGSELIYT
jgi:hypothetical protein